MRQVYKRCNKSFTLLCPLDDRKWLCGVRRRETLILLIIVTMSWTDGTVMVLCTCPINDFYIFSAKMEIGRR